MCLVSWVFMKNLTTSLGRFRFYFLQIWKYLNPEIEGYIGLMSLSEQVLAEQFRNYCIVVLHRLRYT